MADIKNATNQDKDKKEKKVGIKTIAKAFAAKHPKLCKAAKVTGTVIGTACTVFTGAAVAGAIADRRKQPDIQKTVLDDGTEISTF